MNRKYPLSFFLLGLAMNFFLHYFYLFLPGAILCFIGIWNLTCLLIGLAVLGLDLLLSFIEQLQIRKASLSESDNLEYNEFMDACFGINSAGIKELLEEKITDYENDHVKRQEALECLVVYKQLQTSVQDGMTLAELIDAFAQMCQTPVGEPDDLLFETGTFSFTGNKRFYFSLVRQFRFFTDTDEYVQLHLDVLYHPTKKTRWLRKSSWSSQDTGKFFNDVTGSSAYQAVCDTAYAKVEVWIGET